MKDIYIHIGAHKTGSTMLQSILNQIQNDLVTLSVSYESVGHTLGVFLQRNSPLPTDKIQSTRDSMKEMLDAKQEQSFIFSNESYCGDFQDAYSKVGDISADLYAIFDGIANIKILMYVRSQDKFLESSYIQSIKQGETHTFEKFLIEYPVDKLHWDSIIEQYATVFGKENITVLPFEMIKDPTDNFFDAFLKNMGINVQLDMPNSELPKFNESYSETGLEIALRCNPILEPKERVRLRLFIEKNFFSTPENKPILFSKQDRREFMEMYQESNERLYSTYLQDFNKPIYRKQYGLS